MGKYCCFGEGCRGEAVQRGAFICFVGRDGFGLEDRWREMAGR